MVQTGQHEAVNGAKHGEKEDNAFLSLLAELKLTLGGLHQAITDHDRKLERLAQNVAPLDIEAIPVTASTVTDQPDRLSPRLGWIWNIQAILVNGVSAGAITVYAGGVVVVSQTNVIGPEWASLTAPGATTYGKNVFTLVPNQRIVFAGNASLSAGSYVSVKGIQVTEPYWGDYAL